MKTMRLRLILAALIIAAMTALYAGLFSNYWSGPDDPEESAATAPALPMSNDGVGFLCPGTTKAQMAIRRCRGDLRRCMIRLTGYLQANGKLSRTESISLMSIEEGPETIWRLIASNPRTAMITSYRYRPCRGTLEKLGGS